MERIAFATNKDPTDIRLMHLATKNIVMKDIVASFKRDCDFDERKAEIKKFNEENAWRKKALRLSLMAYPISMFYPVHMLTKLYLNQARYTQGIATGVVLSVVRMVTVVYTSVHLSIPADCVN